MKFEISFDFSDDNHYIEDNMEILNIKREKQEGDGFSVNIYLIELNTVEEFQELYEKLERITKENLSFIVTFDAPCIFISFD